MRIYPLGLALLACVWSACAAPRFVNRYRTDMDGKLIAVEGNDTALTFAVQVGIIEAKKAKTGRTFVVLFENKTNEEVTFEYGLSWYDQSGVNTVPVASWSRVTLGNHGQKLESIRQPDAPDLTTLEILVRHPEN